MVNRIFSFLNRDFNGLHEAAFVLGASSFVSQILALVRDRIFASTFGAGTTLDIYYASFRIPDLIYVGVASLVAGSVLIPLIVEKYASGDIVALRKFLNSIMTFFVFALIVVSFIVFLIIPFTTDLVVPGFPDTEQEQFIMLSRILLFSTFLLGLSNLFGSVTQSLRRFFIYALTPVVYNIGIIIGILFFYEPFGISGLAFGVVLGAFFHFAIQIPTVLSSHITPKLTFNPDFGHLLEVLKISLPRAITLSTHNIIIIIFTAIASLMASGSIAVFNLAYNLQSVPLAIIGVSYSVAAFPTLSRLFSSGEQKRFVGYIVTATRHVVFWSLPILTLFIVLRAQIVRVILGSGMFTWEDTRLTAAALALFSFSVVAQSLVLLFVRGYYASGNTRKPLFINIFSSIISVVLVFILLKFFDSSTSFRLFFEDLFRVEGITGTRLLMLPLAFSLGAIMNMSIIWTYFKKDFIDYYVSIRKSIIQIIIGSLIIGFVAYVFLQIFARFFDLDTFIGIFMQGFLSGMAGLFIGVFFLRLIKNMELAELEKTLKRRFWKQKPILPEPEDTQ